MATIEYSAGGIVYKKIGEDIKFLFILDPYGKWAFPKGHIETGESTRTAAVREIAEETGIDVSDIKVIKHIGKTNFWFSLKGKKIHKFLDLFLVEVNPNVIAKPQVEEKIKKIKWVDIDRALEFFGYENGKDALKLAIKYLKK